MITVPALQGIAVVVIALFLLQVAKRLTANATNPILVGVNDGLTFVTSG